MENKKISGNIDKLIALCHIIDDFEEFKTKLTSMMSQNKLFRIQFMSQLIDGSKALEGKKKKKLYRENKLVIDTINNYSDIYFFVLDCFDCNGKLNENFQYFYQYILKHREEIENILAVLEKLKALGFKELDFNENLDFTKKVYEMYSNLSMYQFAYVPNIQKIFEPTYSDSSIKYRTFKANYKIEIKKTTITPTIKRITLNSLIFDIETLPKDLNVENLARPILNLKAEQRTQISKSVELSIGIDDLEKQFELIERIVNNIDDVRNKEELKLEMLKIKEFIKKLQDVSNKYDERIRKEDSSITKEYLEKEKGLYEYKKKNPLYVYRLYHNNELDEI